MSDAVRLHVITSLTSNLRRAVKEERSKEWINMLIDEIEKHTASLGRKHQIKE